MKSGAAKIYHYSGDEEFYTLIYPSGHETIIDEEYAELLWFQESIPTEETDEPPPYTDYYKK